MAALAEAADYAPASLYTYFPSRSALLAALQQRALRNLARVGEAARAGWEADGPADVVALARLWAFSDLFLAAPREHARDFRLQQQLLVSPGVEDTADAATVVPDALAVLDLPRRLLADATATGALGDPGDTLDPVGDVVDGHLLRTVEWTLALNGALMADRLATGLPATGELLGARLTGALLAGWGADRGASGPARALADRWRSTAPGAVRAHSTRTTIGRSPS